MFHSVENNVGSGQVKGGKKKHRTEFDEREDEGEDDSVRLGGAESEAGNLKFEESAGTLKDNKENSEHRMSVQRETAAEERPQND